MKRLTKRQKLIAEQVEQDSSHSLAQAMDLLKRVKATKFDETVEMVLRLGVDPRKADQMVRGTCALPHGLGKTVRVLAFAKGEKMLEAEQAGADYVGGDDLAKKIQEGWVDFDRVVATPDVMNIVGRIGRVLGPRGLMPNPKVGSVTFDIANAVQSIKAGQVEFRVDKQGNLHAPIGKISFDSEKLKENAMSFFEAVNRLKPSSSKGNYIRHCSVSSTMGPGIKIDLPTLK